MKLYNDDTLVSYLKKVMKEEKISIRGFAKISGIPYSTLQRFTSGTSKMTLESAIKIAEGLGMKIELVHKGHGRLGDLDKLEKDMDNGIMAGLGYEGYEKYGNINYAEDCLELVQCADTIIEADKEE